MDSDFNVFVLFWRVSFRSEEIFWNWRFDFNFFFGLVHLINYLADIIFKDTLVEVVLLSNLLDLLIFNGEPFVIPKVVPKVMSS